MTFITIRKSHHVTFSSLKFEYIVLALLSASVHTWYPGKFYALP